VISLPDQPIAERALRMALASKRPPQQLLFFGPPGTGKRAAAEETAWALMEPTEAAPRRATAVDLLWVRASGDTIRLEELDPALAAIAAKPQVHRRRVLVIDGAERLREQEGSSRMLKPLEEPAPRSHIILIAERPGDLMPTIRSRCLPVRFRTPGWRRIAEQLVAQGVEAEEAAGLARADGTLALVAGDFERRMRALGLELADLMLEPGGTPGALVARIQAGVDEAAVQNPSTELLELQAEAASREGQRGGRTAAKRAEDQQKRELRRLSSDGWRHVLGSAASALGDALALALGADGAVRRPGRAERVRGPAQGLGPAVLESMIEEVEGAIADLKVNPQVDLRAEGLLVRVEQLRHGQRPARPAGRLPYLV
jgi:DNA polymerase-3 subunit delta'